VLRTDTLPLSQKERGLFGDSLNQSTAFNRIVLEPDKFAQSAIS
jgi:hypothetical protein